MPDRKITVVETSGGPVRMLDMDGFAGDLPGLVELFEGKGEDEVASFNRAAHGFGGAQWDPVTRTLWRLGRREPGPAQKPDMAGGPEPADIADPPEASRADDPSEVLSATPDGPPRPVDPTPAEPIEPVTRPALPKPLSLPSPRQELRTRLERLLGRNAAPSTPEEADLAEAVCSQLWPHWPSYTGPIDFWALSDILGSVPVSPRQLALLGGEACTRPSATHGAKPPPLPSPVLPRRTGKAGGPGTSRARSRDPP